MNTIGLLSNENVKIYEPRQASVDELRLFHDLEYLKQVQHVSKSGNGFLDMGDTPAFKGCYEASALAAGASLKAVDLVMSGEVDHAMNIAGGLHHAHPGRASGFCIFNDPAISIAYLRKRYSVEKILYLDVDAHHGDGVMYGFYSDPGVLDIDFHEDGHHLFPGTGFTDETGENKASGIKINIPLHPFTGDQAYMRLFREIVPRVVKKFQPQVILWQCGADAHANDLLAHLQLTTASYSEIAMIMDELAHHVAAGHLVVFGGGGYNVANVARTWTLVASALVRYVPSGSIPVGWKKLFEGLLGETAPGVLSSEGEAKHELRPDDSLSQSDSILKDLKRRIPLLS